MNTKLTHKLQWKKENNQDRCDTSRSRFYKHQFILNSLNWDLDFAMTRIRNSISVLCHNRRMWKYVTVTIAVTHAPFHASVLRPASQVGPMHEWKYVIQSCNTRFIPGDHISFSVQPAYFFRNYSGLGRSSKEPSGISESGFFTSICRIPYL